MKASFKIVVNIVAIISAFFLGRLFPNKPRPGDGVSVLVRSEHGRSETVYAIWTGDKYIEMSRYWPEISNTNAP